MAATTTELLQGTLDLLILKAISLGPTHGYGVLLGIQQVSRDKLQIQQGSLYPALYRLGQQPQGEVLQAHGSRPAAAHRGSCVLEASVSGDRPGHRIRTG